MVEVTEQTTENVFISTIFKGRRSADCEDIIIICSMYETATALLMSVQMLLPIFQFLLLLLFFLVIHHNTGKAHIKCQHLQVASQKLSVDSPDIFIQLPVFMKRKQNVFFLVALRVILCVHDKKKKNDLWNNLLLSPRPLPFRLLKIMNSEPHILAHSQVRRRLRSRPGPMAHRAALSYLSPAGQWRTSTRLT